MSTHENENEAHPKPEEGLSVDQLAKHNNNNGGNSTSANAADSTAVESTPVGQVPVGIPAGATQMAAPETDPFRRPSSPLRAERRPKEDDEESALTNIDFTNQEVSAELDRNLNLSDYCISSDADTEKMESDSNENGGAAETSPDSSFAPKLSALVQAEESGSADKRPLDQGEESENESSPKRPKVEETGTPAPSPDAVAEGEHLKEDEFANLNETKEQHPVETEEEHENEAGDEGEGEDALEDEEEDEVAGEESVAPDLPADSAEEKPEEPEEPPKVENEEPEVPEPEEAEEAEEPEEEMEEEDEEEEAENENDGEGDGDGDGENEKDAASAEAARQEALQDITAIEYQFAELRQKLYETKLYKLELELQMCMEGSHPELRGYYEKIASIRDYKLRRAYQRQKYMLKCIDVETHATRTFIHQGHQKHVCDVKNALLDSTTQQWYDINKERRDMDIVVPEVSYHVPVKTANRTLSCITGYAGPAQMLLPGEPVSEDLACEGIDFKYKNNPVDKLEVIVDRMRLNNELSDLQGLKQYFHSFPGAPALNSLRDSEINDDFELLHAQLQASLAAQHSQHPAQQ